MNRTRYLLAASLACIVAGSGAYLHLMRPPQPQQHAAAPVEQKLAGNDVAQAPSTAQAKERVGEASLQTHIPASTEAAKPNEEAAAPAIVAAPPPARPRKEDQFAGLQLAPKVPPATALNAPMPGPPRLPGPLLLLEPLPLPRRTPARLCARDPARRSGAAGRTSSPA